MALLFTLTYFEAYQESPGIPQRRPRGRTQRWCNFGNKGYFQCNYFSERNSESLNSRVFAEFFTNLSWLSGVTRSD